MVITMYIIVYFSSLLVADLTNEQISIKGDQKPHGKGCSLR